MKLTFNITRSYGLVTDPLQATLYDSTEACNIILEINQNTQYTASSFDFVGGDGSAILIRENGEFKGYIVDPRWLPT